jgi:hypothetical protein
MAISGHKGPATLTKIQLTRISAEATKRPEIGDQAFRSGANQGVTYSPYSAQELLVSQTRTFSSLTPARKW